MLNENDEPIVLVSLTTYHAEWLVGLIGEQLDEGGWEGTPLEALASLYNQLTEGLEL
jgi:hypothetical protein